MKKVDDFCNACFLIFFPIEYDFTKFYIKNSIKQYYTNKNLSGTQKKLD